MVRRHQWIRQPVRSGLLCSILAFWCQGNADRIDQLFRRSRLYRRKWDRRDYRERTIARAIANTIASAYSQSAESFEKLLKATNKEQLNNIAIEGSKIAVNLQEADRFLFFTTPFLPQALVDRSRTDDKGHLSFLRATAKQKAELINGLRTMVGTKPEDESFDKTRPTLTLMAVMWWRWLHDEGFQPAI